MRILIVGNGMAGARLAGELHARRAAESPGRPAANSHARPAANSHARPAANSHGRPAANPHRVTVLGAEAHPAYNRILLSSVLAGKFGEADVALAEAAGHGLDIRPGIAVVAIDRAARTLRTNTDEILGYDHLVLATGSYALLPPLRGLPTDPQALPERVAVFRTIDDCRRILAQADRARSALVLGGGLLGLEAARGLAARGLSVRVVHAVGHLMERQLDPAAGAVLSRTLADLGIDTELAAAAVGAAADADGVDLELADGRALRADLLVVACGVRPETGLARAAGLAVERGVVVDDRLTTSDPRISAIGDCAQFGGELTGLVAPAWEQARVLAAALAGDHLARYRPPAAVTRLKAAGIDLAAMGVPGAVGAGQEELSFADPARGTYAKLVLDGERLAGAIMIGDNPSVGTVIQLFDRGTPVPADRRALLLGRSFGPAAATPAASPALMPDAATVCQCNTVTKGALVACWRGGARSVPELVAGTRATTGCGTCVDAVTGIASWLAAADSVPVNGGQRGMDTVDGSGSLRQPPGPAPADGSVGSSVEVEVAVG